MLTGLQVHVCSGHIGSKGYFWHVYNISCYLNPADVWWHSLGWIKDVLPKVCFSLNMLIHLLFSSFLIIMRYNSQIHTAPRHEQTTCMLLTWCSTFSLGDLAQTPPLKTIVWSLILWFHRPKSHHQWWLLTLKLNFMFALCLSLRSIMRNLEWT